MPRKVPQKAARLPQGGYAYRGRAVPFSALPKREQSRFRSIWARKAAETRAAPARKRAPASAERSRARAWLKRRSVKVEQQLEHTPSLRNLHPTPATANEILSKLGTKAIKKIRTLQKQAHNQYRRQGEHGGGAALATSDLIREALGDQLAAMMPQLWWYH